MSVHRKARPLDIPLDLALALKQAQGATAAIGKLPASHHKEYIARIESAKNPDMRKRRIDKAIEMVTHAAKSKG